MGAWSVSVTGNDMARDLKMDYSCAFYRWGESAADKIDEYIRTRFDETDPEEWCNYVYSLADYMWKKGILTDGLCATGRPNSSASARTCFFSKPPSGNTVRRTCSRLKRQSM